MSTLASLTARSDYERQLAALLDDATVLAALAELGLAAEGWRREYGRLHPGEEPFATIVLERDGHGVAPLVHHVACVEAYTGGAGDLELRPSLPADDARLPGLAALAAAPGARIVRWRPHKRCTVRLDQGYAKAFAGRHGARVHAEGVELHAARDLGFAVARPLGYDEDLRVLWQEAVPGEPAATRTLAPGGHALAERMGAAAATLARSGVAPRSTHDAVLAMSKSMLRAAELVGALPGLGARTGELVHGLRAAHAACSSRLAPVHGNLGLDHWIVDGDRLGVVDFDNFALGEPERDAASFVAELEDNAPAGLGDAFVAGWESVAGPLDRRLAGAYAAHRLLRKARLAAWSLKPRAELRAERYLERAIAWLRWEGP